MQAQPRAWEEGFGLVELITKRSDGTRAMRRTLGRQDDPQLRFGNLKVSRTGQCRLQESSAFLSRPVVMRRN